ncbi:hypothetical protein MRX96_059614 [Rhipicephalus microplus]
MPWVAAIAVALRLHIEMRPSRTRLQDDWSAQEQQGQEGTLALEGKTVRDAASARQKKRPVIGYLSGKQAGFRHRPMRLAGSPKRGQSKPLCGTRELPVGALLGPTTLCRTEVECLYARRLTRFCRSKELSDCGGVDAVWLA